METPAAAQTRMSLRTLPRPQPALPLQSCLGWRWAGSCRSALEVGGDFYDVVSLSESSALIAIADVMGKGLPAALFAGSLRTLVRALAKPDVAPAELLSELNNLLFEELSSAEIFITIQLVVTDRYHGHLHIASAGHCPLLVCDRNGRTRSVSPNGMPLGIQRDADFRNESTLLPRFGSVLLYTDGVTEARDRHGRFFGRERLENWLCRTVRRSQSALELKTDLLRELSAFQGSVRGADDQSFLILTDETPRPVAPLSIRQNRFARGQIPASIPADEDPGNRFGWT